MKIQQKLKSFLIYALLFGVFGTVVQAANPVVTSIPVTSVDEDSKYSYTLGATDADGDKLTWSWKDESSKPDWLSFGISVGDTVSTFAGSGSEGSTDANGIEASFKKPSGVAVDSNDNIYVADTDNHKIRKITPDGVVSTFAGSGSVGSTDGNATAASFIWPRGVAVDSNDNIYVVDSSDNKIRKITPDGVVSTLAGSGSSSFADGTGTAASFNSPRGVAVDSNDNIYVADYANHKIRKILSIPKLIGTPTNADVGEYDISLIVSDGTNEVEHNFTITVKNVNDVPTSSDFNITIDEDTNKTFASSDFPFTDDDTIHGDSLNSIIITTLESAGSLKLNGIDVTSAQEIAVVDISKLVFTPVANASGAPYATFGFKVSDGDVNSTDAYTATINVTAVDDAAVIDVPISFDNVENNDSYSINLSATDEDGDAIGYVAVSLDTTKASASLVDGNLVVTPVENMIGQVTIQLHAVSNGIDTVQNITIGIVQPAIIEQNNLTAGKWNMISLPKGKVLDTTGLTGITAEKPVKVFRNGEWVENPTDVTAKEAIWVNPSSTNLDLSGATASTANDFADKTAQFTYYKSLAANEWHFVGVQYTMNWSDLTKAVLTPNSCNGYTFIKYYDSANDSWNTTANIPAGSGIWLRHLCK